MIEAIADPRARLNRADLQYSGIETHRGLQVHGLRQGRDSEERDTCTHHVAVEGARQEGAGTVRDGPRHRGKMRGYGLEQVELFHAYAANGLLAAGEVCHQDLEVELQIGRASCRERVFRSV